VAGETAGEASTLTTAEHEILIRAAVETARGRVRVIAGAGSNSTSKIWSIRPTATPARSPYPGLLHHARAHKPIMPADTRSASHKSSLRRSDGADPRRGDGGFDVYVIDAGAGRHRRCYFGAEDRHQSSAIATDAGPDAPVSNRLETVPPHGPR